LRCTLASQPTAIVATLNTRQRLQVLITLTTGVGSEIWLSAKNMLLQHPLSGAHVIIMGALADGRRAFTFPGAPKEKVRVDHARPVDLVHPRITVMIKLRRKDGQREEDWVEALHRRLSRAWEKAGTALPTEVEVEVEGSDARPDGIEGLPSVAAVAEMLKQQRLVAAYDELLACLQPAL